MPSSAFRTLRSHPSQSIRIFISTVCQRHHQDSID
jgi:hypothetical protein